MREAYQVARNNDGARGIDGVTFGAIEESGAEGFLVQIRDELVTNTYRPMQPRQWALDNRVGYKVFQRSPASRCSRSLTFQNALPS